MAKRGAGDQIHKDRPADVDDDADEGGEEQGQFAMAPRAELAVRKIRGLPSRSSSSSPAPSAPAPPPASSFILTPATPPKARPASDPLIAYYTSTRSLNVTFLAALKQAVDVDAFVDCSFAFERYVALRKGIAVPTAVLTAAASAAAPTPTTAPTAAQGNAMDVDGSVKQSAAAVGMPVPPQVFAWGGRVGVADNAEKVGNGLSTTASTGGFVVNPAKAASSGGTGGFSFPAGAVIPGLSSSSEAEKEMEKEKKKQREEKERKEKESAIAEMEKARKLSLARSTTPIAPSPLRYAESVPFAPAPSTSTSATMPTATAAAPSFSFNAAFGAIANPAAVSSSSSTFSFNPLRTTSPTPTAPPAPFIFGSAVTAQLAAPSPPSTSSGPSSSSSSAAAVPMPIAIAPVPNPIALGGFGQSASPPTFAFGAGVTNFASSKSSSFGVVGSGGGGAGFGFGLSSSTTTSSAATKVVSGFEVGAAPTMGASTKMFSGFASGAAPTTTVATSTAPTFNFGATAAPAFSFGASSAPVAGIHNFGSAASTPFFSPLASPPSLAPVAAVPSATIVEINEEGGAETDPSATTVNTLVGGVGEGENDDRTIHCIRGRVYRVVEGAGEGQETSAMASIGLGDVMIKEMETPKGKVRRLLAKNDITGNVMINFRLTGIDLPLKVEKNFITFQGFVETTPTVFRIGVKGVAFAEELARLLDESTSSKK